MDARRRSGLVRVSLAPDVWEVRFILVLVLILVVFHMFIEGILVAHGLLAAFAVESSHGVLHWVDLGCFGLEPEMFDGDDDAGYHATI